jgi:pyridoxal phosphate enzyme (YggS family)
MHPDRIRLNADEVERTILAACQRSGRSRSEVLLIAVSKTFTAADVESALRCGISEIGENRVQEARDKKPEVTTPARWHLIGHLQSNKAAEAVRLFDVVHTIDSAELAARLGREAARQNKALEVLLQVNVGNEPQKSGIAPAEARALAHQVAAIDSLRLTGLMTIPPAGDPTGSRRCFAELRALRDLLAQDLGASFRHLSMGMSDDFEAAIEEGSTMIRVGRGIFGNRG